MEGMMGDYSIRSPSDTKVKVVRSKSSILRRFSTPLKPTNLRRSVSLSYSKSEINDGSSRSSKSSPESLMITGTICSLSTGGPSVRNNNKRWLLLNDNNNNSNNNNNNNNGINMHRQMHKNSAKAAFVTATNEESIGSSCSFWTSDRAMMVYVILFVAVLSGRFWLLHGISLILVVEIWWILAKWVLHLCKCPDLKKNLKFFKGILFFLCTEVGKCLDGEKYHQAVIGYMLFAEDDGSPTLTTTIIRNNMKKANQAAIYGMAERKKSFQRGVLFAS